MDAYLIEVASEMESITPGNKNTLQEIYSVNPSL